MNRTARYYQTRDVVHRDAVARDAVRRDTASAVRFFAISYQRLIVSRSIASRQIVATLYNERNRTAAALVCAKAAKNTDKNGLSPGQEDPRNRAAIQPLDRV